MDKFTSFFKLYDKWRGELNSSAHKASMQFEYYRHDPSENQYITDCFAPSISTTHREGLFFRTMVTSGPDFLNKMSATMGNNQGRGWSADKKEQFTLHLVMTAIEKVLCQTSPYQIVKL